MVTVEGIGRGRDGGHAVQARLAQAHGSQCGFCTPGIVMSMYALLRATPVPAEAQIAGALEGNLCRCTWYRPILDAFKAIHCCGWLYFTHLQTFASPGGSSSCPCGREGGCCKDLPSASATVKRQLVDVAAFAPYDASQEPIFPPKLHTRLAAGQATLLHVTGGDAEWIQFD